MAARFVQRLLTSSQVPELGSKQVVAKYYVCHPSELTTSNCGTNKPANWSYYGTNASFFNPGNGNMAAFHINSKGTVRIGGDMNCANLNDLTTRMDCMYGQNHTVNGNNYSVTKMKRTNTAPTSSDGTSILWVIGGFDLLVLGEYSTSAALKTAIDNGYKMGVAPLYSGSITNIWLPAYGISRGRTAIGYKSSSEVIFGLFLGGTQSSPKYNGVGPTVFELHKIMKYLGSSGALLLDGGGSSQAKWKNSAGNVVYSGDSRSVYCQLALTTDAASSCNWSATS